MTDRSAPRTLGTMIDQIPVSNVWPNPLLTEFHDQIVWPYQPLAGRWWIARNHSIYDPSARPAWTISSTPARPPTYPYVYGGYVFTSYEQARRHVAAAVDAWCQKHTPHGKDHP